MTTPPETQHAYAWHVAFSALAVPMVTDTPVNTSRFFAQPGVHGRTRRRFTVPHPSDNQAYKEIRPAEQGAQAVLAAVFQAPRGLPEPVLTAAGGAGRGCHGDCRHRSGRATGIPFRRRYGVGKGAGDAKPGGRQDGFGLRRAGQDRGAEIPVPPWRRDSINFGEAAYYYDQFYDLISRIPGADRGAGGQS